MLIRQLIEEVQDDARLSPYLELIPKKYKKTQMDFMHLLTRLGYLFYLTDKPELSDYLIDKMLAIQFEGDYRYWESVQNIGLLGVHIDKPKYGESVRDMMAFARAYGDEDSAYVKQKVHKRFLTGHRLNDLRADVQGAKDPIAKMNKSFLLLYHLFYLDAFSEELEMEHQIVRDEIKDTLAALGHYIRSEGFNNLFPFK